MLLVRIDRIEQLIVIRGGSNKSLIRVSVQSFAFLKQRVLCADDHTGARSVFVSINDLLHHCERRFQRLRLLLGALKDGVSNRCVHFFDHFEACGGLIQSRLRRLV